MGGKTEQKTEQQQNSKTEPWAPAQPLLQSILSKAGGISTDVTGGQNAAVANLAAGAAGIPNLGPQATNVATGLLGSSVNPQYRGMLSDTFGSMKAALQPYASGANIGANNPALRGYLDIARDDASNAVNSMFTGAGRDFSGAHAQSLGRGIAAAEAPILADQYNKDVANQFAANNALYNAGLGTVSGLQGLDQTAIGNQQAGLSAAGMLPGLYIAPGTAQLGAANAAYALPWQNLGMLSGSVVPIAGLGAQSSGTSTGTQTQSSDPLSNIFGYIAGNAAMAAKMYLSDIRIKEDIRPVGMLFDDTPVYSFRYKGDPSERTYVGLMAQDVEQDTPEAVGEFGGVKMVDYERATDRAAVLGMLAGMI